MKHDTSTLTMIIKSNTSNNSVLVSLYREPRLSWCSGKCQRGRTNCHVSFHELLIVSALREDCDYAAVDHTLL